MPTLQRISWKLAVFLGAVAGSITFLPIGQASDTQSCLRRHGQIPTYPDAVQDTLDPQDCERWTHLTPIRQDNPNLIWRDDQVLMVTWTWPCDESINPNSLACMNIGDRYAVPVVPTENSYRLWVTAAPEVRSFVMRESYYNPDFVQRNITSRLEQYLGLKPGGGSGRVFVEIWVSPDDIIRPCLDEDPSDNQCEIWNLNDLEQGSRFASAIGSEELDGEALDSEELNTRYPFTGLGYTYDWGNPNTDVGASEFVIRDGSTVTLYRTMSTQDYVQGVMPNL